ncbi:DUF4189 domain-containing protein [Pseudonocardia zijingensis]|jgi:hypothetical protein|uniref:DUF4189 domain-containing protein n=1 Tax=Pseudonocardia zijingensis TaxID=153376 RepID=A0ABN1QMC8_9PSEU
MGPIRSTITRAAVVTLLTAGASIMGATPASAAPGTWAAIAVSVQTGNVGWSYEQPSGGAAASAAVDGCDARDCQEVVRVTNGCAAVAQASNRAWGWAYAASRAEAEREAKRSAPGKGARVIAYTCTGAYR